MSVEFHCPQCGQLLRVPDNTRGKKGRCPHCKAINEIPKEGEPAPKTPSPAVTPAPQVYAPPPLASPDPFASTPAPAAPSPAAPDLFANLGTSGTSSGTPHDLFGGLGPSPAAANPYADPLGSGGYGGGYASGYAGGYAAPTGGYAAPAAGYGAYQAPRYVAPEPEFNGPIDDSDRPGIPWERRHPQFMETVKQVLLSPAQAFGNMHRSGGMGSPLWFAIQGGFFGGLFTLGYSLLWDIFTSLLGLAIGGAPPEFAGAMLIAIVVKIVIGVVAGLIGLAIFGTLGTIMGVYISAAILHLVLMMLSGARAGFEATFRLTCYAHGSLQLLNFIPLFGFLAIFVMTFVVYIIGLRWTHEISIGKSVAAVLITMGIFIALAAALVVLMIVVVTAIIAAFAGAASQFR